MSRVAGSAYGVILAIVLLAMAKSCVNPDDRVNQHAGSAASSPGRFFRSIWIDSANGSGSGKLLTIILYPEDLGCRLCIVNLLWFCDLVRNSPRNRGRNNIILLVGRGQGSFADQKRKIKSWTSSIGLNIPAFLVERDSLHACNIDYSSAIVIDSSGAAESNEMFPLSDGIRDRILEKIARPNR